MHLYRAATNKRDIQSTLDLVNLDLVKHLDLVDHLLLPNTDVYSKFPLNLVKNLGVTEKFTKSRVDCIYLYSRGSRAVENKTKIVSFSSLCKFSSGKSAC